MNLKDKRENKNEKIIKTQLFILHLSINQLHEIDLFANQLSPLINDYGRSLLHSITYI